MKITKDWIPFFVAVGIAIIVGAYYVISGRSSYDLKVRQLSQNTQIEAVDGSDQKKVRITCKNGESYEIVFKKEQPDYESLIFNSCGGEGGQYSE